MQVDRPHDPRWLSSGLLGVWALSVCGVIVGGALGWVALGIGLCGSTEGGAGSYCNEGGWEASGLGVVAAIGLALVLPIFALFVDRRGLFRLGLVLPVALLATDIIFSVVVAMP